MRKYYLISIIFFSLTSQVFPQNWFPLEDGNKWQYFTRSWIYNGAATQYYILQNEANLDTVINGKEYYTLFDFYYGCNHLYRYDKDFNILFRRYNDSDYVFMNFNLTSGTSFYKLSGGCNDPLAVEAIVIEDSVAILDSTVYCKGYERGCDELLYAQDIGLVYRKRSCSSWGGTQFIMTQAVLYDTNGINIIWDKTWPKPEVDTVFLYDNFSKAFFIVVIDHKFSRLADLTYPNNIDGVSYIDKAGIESFYQKGDSILTNDTIYMFPQNEIRFLRSLDLNTELLSSGYDLYYRIWGTDKGLIPRTGFTPDTGYFKLDWDTTTTTAKNNIMLNSFALSQNYPNPFNPSTTIKYDLPERSFVTLKVYDVLGNEIETLVSEEKPLGRYEVDFNATELPSGIYFYKLQAGSFVETKKMVFMK
jgi:hypothetical protein